MTGQVDAWCASVTQLHHMLPVWRALPEDARGRFWLHHSAAIVRESQRLNFAPYRFGMIMPVRRGNLVLVGSGPDTRFVNAPCVLVEHGAGQSYVDSDHESYAGGRARERVVLFLCPNDRVADANRARYPSTPSVVVGSPRVEHLRSIRGDDGSSDVTHPGPHARPVVAVSRHWDCYVAPETRTAWPEYREAVGALDRSTFDVRLHSHPRCMRDMLFDADRMGLPFVERFEDVVRDADAYVIDNSSTLYEAAACDIPVLALNASWYRRDVHHGLRFWSHVPGQMVHDPAHLTDAVHESFDPSWADVRRRVIAEVFPVIDGAAALAAAAIVERL